TFGAKCCRVCCNLPRLRIRGIRMFRRISFLAWLLAWCASVCTAQSAPTQPVSFIRAGKLLDVDSGRLLTNQMILLRGGKIEAVGEHVTVPSRATVIDLSKFTRLPVLIDCHTHLADLTDGDPLGVLQRIAAENAYPVIPNPRVTLRPAFT